VRRLARAGAWLCVGVLVTACAILPGQEFPQAVDPLSQGAVVERWGLPQSIVTGAEGQTLWIYTAGPRISPSWVVPRGWPCTQYLLRFDQMQVLRGWTARRC
jgi:hypothetical protein